MHDPLSCTGALGTGQRALPGERDMNAGPGGPGSERVRLNTTITPQVAKLIEARAAEWGVAKGEVIDRLVEAAVGTESAQHTVALGGDALETTMRGVLADFTLQTAQTLRALLEPTQIEVTTARLLLFALLCASKSPEAAILNEDAALAVARSGVAAGTIPLMLRQGRAARMGP